MSDFVTDIDNVPAAPFYVRARDTFMSGWGQSPGRDNYVLLPCESMEEACVVRTNAMARTDMEDVRIVSGVQALVERQDVTVSLFDREDAERWYTPGGFNG